MQNAWGWMCAWSNNNNNNNNDKFWKMIWNAECKGESIKEGRSNASNKKYCKWRNKYTYVMNMQMDANCDVTTYQEE